MYRFGCSLSPKVKSSASYHGQFTIIDYGKLAKVSAGQKGRHEAENRRDADDRAARCHYLPPQKFPAAYHGGFTIINYGKPTIIEPGVFWRIVAGCGERRQSRGDEDIVPY